MDDRTKRITDEVIEIVNQHVWGDEEDDFPAVTQERTFKELGFDEIDLESVIIDCEEVFLVTLPDGEVNESMSLAQLVALIQQKQPKE